MNQGWQCPKCGFCYAPFQPECLNCNREQISINTATNALTPEELAKFLEDAEKKPQEHE